MHCFVIAELPTWCWQYANFYIILIEVWDLKVAPPVGWRSAPVQRRTLMFSFCWIIQCFKIFACSVWLICSQNQKNQCGKIHIQSEGIDYSPCFSLVEEVEVFILATWGWNMQHPPNIKQTTYHCIGPTSGLSDTMFKNTQRDHFIHSTKITHK